MTLNLNHRKQQLIQRIAQIKEENHLLMLERYMTDIEQENIEIEAIFKPSKKTISVEELIEEQNYTGIDKAKMDRLIEEMDIQEPLEDLLKMLYPNH